MSSNLPYLDVLRGVAILAVLFHHLPPELGAVFGRLYDWGGRGVDLFFVLSGFLIGRTTLERARAHRVPQGTQAGVFWLLRCARILPLYASLLAAYAMGSVLVPREVTSVLRDHPLPYVTFTSNWFQQTTLELGVLWSLAIEEQFYFVVGMGILLFVRRPERLAGVFAALAGVAIVGSLVYRFQLEAAYAGGEIGVDRQVPLLFFSTWSRMDQLGMGLLCAVVAPWLNRRAAMREERAARVSTWAAIAGGIWILVSFPHEARYGFTVLGIVFAMLTLWAQRPGALLRGEAMVDRWLLAPLAFVGKLSFGLYLLHPLARSWVSPLSPLLEARLPLAAHAVIFFLVWLIVALLVSTLSHRLLETPALARARRAARAMLERPLPIGALSSTN